MPEEQGATGVEDPAGARAALEDAPSDMVLKPDKRERKARVPEVKWTKAHKHTGGARVQGESELELKQSDRKRNISTALETNTT